ncbi:MAG: hypothetical protein EAX90_08750 [Candidatus Heimdallarchaeota archaeon]|nr:hypothetical protein [Candidatus Heimdallarchaeota archaeon]
MKFVETDELESITKIENLKLLALGESIPKFTGKYKNQNILLRVFPKDDYYNNRFQREGDALRSLAKVMKKLSFTIHDYSFIFPEIIQEWNEKNIKYSIRALNWIQGKPIKDLSYPHKLPILNSIWQILEEALKYMPDKYSFEKDFICKLKQPITEQQKKNYTWQKYLEAILDLEQKNDIWEKTETHMIHGDLHYGNILRVQTANYETKKTYSIIDWEFASKGSIYFDLAYAQVFSGIQFPKYLQPAVDMWKSIAIAIITNWYLVNEPMSDKTKRWLKKLKSFV